MAARLVGDEDPLVADEELPPDGQRLDHWERVWLPEVQSILERLAAFDREEATDEELVLHLGVEAAGVTRAWAIHGVLDFYQEEFAAFCDERLDLDVAASTRMVQGLPNKSLEADAALRALAHQAAATPAVLAALGATAPLAALRGTPEAAAFLEGLGSYLDAWGRRSENFMEMAFPSWTEDPSPVFALIRMYIAVPRDVEADRRRLADEREAAVAEVRERVSGELGEEFEAQLERAQRGAMLNEDHNFWIDQQTLHWVRQTLIEIGRRLASRGAIAAANDVTMLHLDEVRESLLTPDGDLRALVETRRASRTRRPARRSAVRRPRRARTAARPASSSASPRAIASGPVTCSSPRRPRRRGLRSSAPPRRWSPMQAAVSATPRSSRASTASPRLWAPRTPRR